MKKRALASSITFVAAAILPVLLILSSCSRNSGYKSSQQNGERVDGRQKSEVATPWKGSQDPVENLQALTQAMADHTRSSRAFEDFIRYLADSGQQPRVYKESAVVLGDIYIVRTESPPPGTRYFHAIYEEEENGELVMRHMSFDYRAGEKSFKEAVQAIEKAFPDGKKRDREGSVSDFFVWELPDGYVVWVKKMVNDDIIDHPINAYTEDDLGTIKVAIEINPH